jgi:hypothetical protein
MSKVGDPALSKKVFWILPSFLALACAPPYPYLSALETKVHSLQV